MCECKSRIRRLCALSPAELTLAATALGIALSDGLDADEQDLLANVLFSAAQTVQTISSRNGLCDNQGPGVGSQGSGKDGNSA